MSAWDDDLPRYWGVATPPVSPPHAPDKVFEIMHWLLVGATLLGAATLATYLYLALQQPEAAWTALAVGACAIGPALGAASARKKRLAAEAAVERYRETIARAAADL